MPGASGYFVCVASTWDFERKGERDMSAPVIDATECTGCGICVDTCPNGVLDIVGSSAAVVNEDSCVECGECVEECPLGAIDLPEDEG